MHVFYQTKAVAFWTVIGQAFRDLGYFIAEL